MRFPAVIWIAAVSAILAPNAPAQTVHIEGTVKDADGAPLTARISVLVDGHEVRLVISNDQGKYSADVKGSKEKMVLSCTAVVDPDAVHYERNPLEKQPPFKDYDFTFREVTTSASYWHSVSNVVDFYVSRTPLDTSSSYVTLEWNDINNSRLPPDSKAAAAHQFKLKDWSTKIRDSSFSDYVMVDDHMLKMAMQGDQKALDSLPTTVKRDVLKRN
jgi:hypothetical protein